jgi:hypothetical protein
MPSGEQQPGLFDRRTERAWHARASEREHMRAEAEAQCARVEAASALHVTDPELMLVLHTSRSELPR